LVDQNQAGGTLEAICLHGQGNGSVGRAPVYAYRKRYAVFMDERLERYRPHGFMMFEHCMQTDNAQFVQRESVVYGFRLGNAVADASRAEHLKGVYNHDPAP